jgi:hypothetical protein
MSEKISFQDADGKRIGLAASAPLSRPGLFLLGLSIPRHAHLKPTLRAADYYRD